MPPPPAASQSAETSPAAAAGSAAVTREDIPRLLDRPSERATGQQRRPCGDCEKERRETWAFQCGSLCQGAAAAAAAEARSERGAAFSGYFYL